MRFLRHLFKLLWIIVSACITLVAFSVLAILFFPNMALKPIVGAMLEEKTGGQITIRALSFHNGKAVLQDVTYTHPKLPLKTLKANQLSLDMKDLFSSGKFRSVTLQEIQFTLPSSSLSFQGNMSFKTSPTAIEGEGLIKTGSIPFNTQIHFNLHTNNTSISLTSKNVSLPTFYQALPSEWKTSPLKPVKGNISYSLSFFIPATGSLTSSATFILQDGEVVFKEGDVEGLTGRIQFSSLSPLITQGFQTFQAQKAFLGLPLQDLTFTWKLTEKELIIEKGIAHGFSGNLHLLPTSFLLSSSQMALPLHIENFDLKELMQFLAVKDLEATGKISGDLSLKIAAQEFYIDGTAHLKSGSEPGILKYTRPIVEESSIEDETASMAVNILKDFHYKTLELDITKPQGGKLGAKLHLTGANPNVISGHPLDFHLNLSGDLQEMLEQSHRYFRIQEQMKGIKVP